MALETDVMEIKGYIRASARNIDNLLELPHYLHHIGLAHLDKSQIVEFSVICYVIQLASVMPSAPPTILSL
jgi:hypothetical protein